MKVIVGPGAAVPEASTVVSFVPVSAAPAVPEMSTWGAMALMAGTGGLLLRRRGRALDAVNRAA